MEFLSQYDYKIVYVKGDDNTVADALSRTEFDDAESATEAAAEPWGLNNTGTPAIAAVLRARPATPFYSVQCLARTRISEPKSASVIAPVLTITADAKILDSIRKGYSEDKWCAGLASAGRGMPGLEFREDEGLWSLRVRQIIQGTPRCVLLAKYATRPRTRVHPGLP
ncbi:hypothetical protein DFH06DRAFT_1138865 [Mycena polygramma]|nr:hypothetical protein DFH06DRAFT_1138865 [Mycena polygramma]